MFLLAAVVAAPLAEAHHSYAMFDFQKNVTLEGTVKNFKWSSPHALIEVTVMYKAGPVDWTIEMGSVGGLMRSGWSQTTIKPGDKVKVVVHPLRDGNAGGSFLSITLPNGTVLGGGGVGGANRGGAAD